MVRAPTTTSYTKKSIQPIIHHVGSILNQPLRILHVDDTEGILILHRLHLERRPEDKIEYIGVLDSATAFETITNWRPDLIISDISRPDMDGFTFTSVLKSRPDTHQIPIAFLTANAGQHNRERAYAAGASAYFVKPGFPHMAKIQQLAAQHRIENTMRNIAPNDQQLVFDRLLKSHNLNTIMRGEVQRQLDIGR